jgi:hypothetical protein
MVGNDLFDLQKGWRIALIRPDCGGDKGLQGNQGGQCVAAVWRTGTVPELTRASATAKYFFPGWSWRI